MFLSAKIFCTPKAGNTSSEYEDAYWPHHDSDWNVELFRYAVADGATQTSFSGKWAKLLVRAYCKGLLASNKFYKSIKDLQQQWLDEVSSKQLPWFAQEKVRQGAFSTICGLTVSQRTSIQNGFGHWQAFAIGDSCLFHIRGHELLKAFPLETSDQFNSSPALLSSNHLSNKNLTVLTATGNWQSGDLFLLMTDALACWFLRRNEERANPIEQLTNVECQQSFEDFLNEQRMVLDQDGRKYLRNDDITLLRIYIG